MPATRHSVLDAPGNPATDLRPGESGINLKDDPYYGKVDAGATPKPDAKPGPGDSKADAKSGSKGKVAGAGEAGESAREATNEKVVALQEKIDEGVHALDGEEQNHVEVLTGKRLQQKTLEPRPPEADGAARGKTEKKAPEPPATAGPAR